MFVFGVCIDSPDLFDRHCLPAIAAYGGADATLITSPDLPVATTYNDILASTLDLEGVEAVVLLRDDVEITDPHFRSKVRAAFAEDPHLAVLGPGGQTHWWQERAGSSSAAHAPTDSSLPSPLREVDYVDGSCLVLRPSVAAKLRFDDHAFPGPTGFDIDFCARARAAGLKVALAPLDVEHHAEPGGEEGYRAAAAVWQGRRAKNVGRDTLERALAAIEGTHVGPERYGELPAVAGPPEGYYEFRHPTVVESLPPTTSRVLQLGCGAGTLGAEITRAIGARVTGLDSDMAPLHHARRQLDRVIEIDLNRIADLPCEQGSFDAIVAADILDRLVDPEKTLRAVLPYLSAEGVLVATIPNIKHWSVVLPLLVQDRFEYSDAGILHRGALRFFTMVETLAMLGRLGMARIEVCGAEEMPLSQPDRIEPLVACIATYGTDPNEARTMLNAYEYVVLARRS
ncbi:methyltransferase domain-containing protein [Gephyromycinifex aptenodytis]|uniref:methyltransferase domain-containing protein n=1 Tax=Gephyromycinifex aptenodytis TaxID=2716227 RepID=UPI00144743F6|nr:methyltransferase domain-containing protein [Gephyromycinifex aptenodytis]